MVNSIGRRRLLARSGATPAYSERRELLLASAAEVFKQKGLQGASINDISERLGGDRASIYYYYKNKHEIFIDLIMRSVEEVVLLAETIASSDEPTLDRLEHVLRSTMAAYERHHPYMFVYIQEDMRKVMAGEGGEAVTELKQLGDRYEGALAKIIADGVAAGELPSTLDQQVFRFAVIGALNWSHRWYVPGRRLTGDAIGRNLADVFLNGVRAQPRPESG